MDVVSRCALRVGSLVWQAADGSFVLTIACKATYLLQPGISHLAEHPDDIQAADSYWDDDDRRSLHAAGELVPFKPQVDVLLTGSAYAPEGQVCRSLVSRLMVGSLNKAIEVYGDRAVHSDGRISAPSAFEKMPLRWERAAGGPGTSNPVGIRMGTYGASAVPNLQPPGTFLTTIWDAVEPIGFGPIAPIWPERLARLGHVAATWDHDGWYRRPLPAHLDAGYFNCAPPDQQIGDVAPDERIVLENLHRTYPRLSTNLAGVVPRAVLQRAGGREEIAFRCDTLWIDTDRGTCSVLWRAWAALRSPHEEGLVVVTDDGQPSEEAADATITLLARLEAPDRGNAPTLPFVPGQSPLAEPLPRVTAAPATVPEDDGTGTVLGVLVPSTRALPFHPLPQGPQRIAPEPVPVAAPSPANELLRGVPSFVEEPSEEETRETLRPPRAPVAPPALLPVSPPPLVAPPPSVAAAEPSISSSESAANEAPAPSVDPGTVSIERHAAMAATLDHGRTPREDALREEAWTEQDWTAIEQHIAETLAAEARSGGYKLRLLGDAAYVTRLESLRGPIQPAEYARILRGIEAGTSSEVLRELDIPAAALMRIVRLWTAKLARDPKLSMELMKSMAASREGTEEESAATL